VIEGLEFAGLGRQRLARKIHDPFVPKPWFI
jgi:hypothetical protein